jgi:GNAT superfamily N-acetyltransferase
MGQPRLKIDPAPKKPNLRVAGPISLSAQLWKIDWEAHFPKTVHGDHISIEKVTLKEVARFVSNNLELVYGDSPANLPFLAADKSQAASGAKERYYEENGDFFVFKDGTKVIGIFVGTVTDWQTYYWRSMAILHEYQGRGIYQSFLNSLVEVLKVYGVTRIEGDVSPANFGSIHVFLKLGFFITGFNASERWGTLVHFTRFLDDKHLSTFLGQFCCGVPVKKKVSQAGG